MKKSVTQFDLSAAFKALDEMEYPKVEGGIRPNRIDLKENFADRKLRTDILVEDYYDISDNNELNAAAEEREAEVAKAKLARIEKIVDLDAESEDELLTSYEGKVIIQCPQCMTLFYKNEEDLEVDENNPDVVNINETCQHCGNTSGYMVIGKVAPVEEEELDNFDTEDFEEEPVEEGEEEATEEEPTEETEEEDLGNLDALDLDFDEEETEETNESLNKAEIQKEVDKKHCSENDSENLTLNEAVAVTYAVINPDRNKNVWVYNARTKEECEKFIESRSEKNLQIIRVEEPLKDKSAKEEALAKDKGEAAAQDELQAEHEAPIEEGKKCCAKCGKEICKCDKQELKESEVEDAINSVMASWDLGEGCEGKDCEKPLKEDKLSNYSNDDQYQIIKKACKAAKLAGEPCPYVVGKWIVYGVDKTYTPIITKEFPATTKPFDIKNFRDDLLDTNKEVFGVYISRICKEVATGKTEEVDCSTYMKFKDDFADEEIEESLNECDGKDCSIEEAIKDILLKESLNKAEVQKDVDKKHCANNDSENLTLNEAKEEDKEEEFDDSELAMADEDVEKVNEPFEGEDGQEEAEEAEENADEEALNEQPVETTIGEVKEVAEEVAEKVAGPVEDEEKAEEQAEEIKEIVDEVVENKFGEEANDLENKEVEEEAVEGEEPEVESEEEVEEEAEEEIEEVVEEGLDSEKELEGFVPIEAVEEALTEDSEEVSDAEFNKLVNSPDFEAMLKDPNALEECGINKVFENVDEADEEAFEECISEALTSTYENVKNFTLTECLLEGSKFIVEGTINFNSGKTRKTQYIFEKAMAKEDKTILEGYNNSLAKDGNFRVNCLIKEACLVPQSMSYKYNIEENLVEGLATRK